MAGKIFCKKEEGKTRQSFKEECDINKIVAKYKKTGRLPELIRQNPIYGDFSKSFDYQEALNTVQKAQLQFNELSSEIRNKFRNDPVEFLMFVEDPKNEKELVEMGLAYPKKVESGTEKQEGPAQGPGKTKTEDKK